LRFQGAFGFYKIFLPTTTSGFNIMSSFFLRVG